MILDKKDRIICALDTKDIDVATKLIEDVKEFVGMFKVGLEFYTANGPHGLGVLATRGMPIFLDLKFHDIPNTVSEAIKSINKFDFVKMITVHSGDEEMIKAAVNASKNTEVIVVTLLTSMKIKNAKKIVLERTEEALSAGAHGIVCSPKEVKAVRHKFGHNFKIVCPGIRLPGQTKDDQKRIGTPEETIKNGADYIVVGRAITRSDNPRNVAYSILRDF